VAVEQVIALMEVMAVAEVEVEALHGVLLQVAEQQVD